MIGATEQQTTAELAYDRVPYPRLSYTQTHPDNLSTVASLLGMNPAPVDRCRVLELGCAGGGNLIPMAYGLPASTFVGIDVSGRQIAEGHEAVAALGLANITLRHMDIMDVDQSLGQFDYIIAHGVYSWVPAGVQDKLLSICSENLRPNGVAYVSYNTYPGWHMINIVRDLMQYGTRDISDPALRAREGRGLLAFMANACDRGDSAYGSFLGMYARLLEDKMANGNGRSESLLLHDELENINNPIYFHEFVRRAERCGLQYLGEARFSKMTGSGLPAEAREKLGAIATSVIDLEQYFDFLNNRPFRQTLLCHTDIAVQRSVSPALLRKMFVASRAQPVVPDPNLCSVSVVKFCGSDGSAISTDHPITKVALTCLAEIWPQALHFAELLSLARARLDRVCEGLAGGAADGDLDAEILASNLLTAYGYSDSLVELRVHVTPLVIRASERPEASPVARLGTVSDRCVTNLRHERVKLDGLDSYLLRHLDGSRDRAALLDLLMEGPVASGQLTLQKKELPDRDMFRPEQAEVADSGRPGVDSKRGRESHVSIGTTAQADPGSDELRRELQNEIETRLGWLARAALLIG